MSLLQVYLSWANSLLCETGRSVDNVAAIQDGRILCELIDILAPDAGLSAKIQAAGTCTPRAYIQAALEHMKRHGVSVTFSAQDILDGDVKSLLSVMWLLILNYGVHFIGTNTFQRTSGVGKRTLLEWCQGELEVAFNPQNTLAFNLCTGGYFTQLLHKQAGRHVEDSQDKVTHLQKLLQEIDERYGIKRSIISPNDIIDGTIDEHTLMIYLSLLKRRASSTARTPHREMLSVDGKEAAIARVQERHRSLSEEAEKRRLQSEALLQQQQQQQQQQQSQQQQQQLQQLRAVSLDSSLIVPTVVRPQLSQESAESDLFWTDSNSLMSGRDSSTAGCNNFLVSEAEQVLRQTISERVKEHLPTLRKDEDKDTDASQGHSERETESISEFSSGALDEGFFAGRKDPFSPSKPRNVTAREKPTTSAHHQQQTPTKRPAGGRGGEPPSPPAKRPDAASERSAEIKLKRPKDYFLQWEETIDRLSHGPHASIAVHGPDGPPRSPRDRSASSESDVYGSRRRSPVWQDRRSESDTPGTSYRRMRFIPPRSSSLPHDAGPPTPRDGQAERRRSPGTAQTVPTTSTPALRHSDLPERERHLEGTERTASSDEQQRQMLSQLPLNNSDFVARLQELKRSGRAQRIVLPGLGPDASVLMIPGQGEEVLLLFDALRQARNEVNLNTTGFGARRSDSGGTSDRSPDPGTHSRQSPSRQNPTQSPDSETNSKKAANAGGAHRDRTEGMGLESGRRSPASTEDEETDVLGRLPRPAPYHHRLSRPRDIRVTDLQSGTSRDPRRTRSLTERPVSISPLVMAAESARFHSLSPRREQEWFGRERGVTRSPAGRISVRLSGGDAVVERTRTDSSDRNSITSSTPVRSYSSSPVALRSSPSHSPYRHHTSIGISPLRSTSPRGGSTPEHLPPLEFPDDLVSPRSRVGGQGRVPRREAWERQRQRGRDSTTRRHDTGIKADSNAQAKFIEVLCKEIEELKRKIEIMEDSSPERTSPNRPRTVYTATATGKNDTFYTSRSEIQETDTKMVLAPRGNSPGPPTQARHSPRPWEATSTPARASSGPHRARSPPGGAGDTARSPRRLDGRDSPRGERPRGRQSPSPERSSRLAARPVERAQPGISASAGAASPVRSSPGAGNRVITLGYKSPIRSVTQEIWGNDLAPLSSLDSQRKENCKRLLSARSLSEEEVIELKQSLASAVVENDILQAKLNNARLEIQDKMGQTNEVLDDCRRHLAKSQAENMELRTALERERERADTSGSQVRGLELLVQQATADNAELEDELTHALTLLERSKPSIDVLKQDNAQLNSQLSVTQNENCALKKELDELRRSHVKSVSTVRELRTCLDEARQERSSLQLKVSQLERQQNEAKVKAIMTQYSQEKGAQDEAERELSSSGVSSSSERHRPSGSSAYHSSARKDDTTPRIPSSKTALARDAISASSAVPNCGPDQRVSYSYDDLTPIVPSSYREIYPHRRTSRYRNLSAERYADPRHDSAADYVNDPDLQHYPTKLNPAPDSDDELSPRDTYSRPRSPSPTGKPLPCRPYSDSQAQSTSFASERPSERDATRRSLSPRQTRGRSPGRASAVVTARRLARESRSSSCSPARSVSGERRNRAYDSVTFESRKRRSASSSPRRYRAPDSVASRKGILRNLPAGRYNGDMSDSPRYMSSRSHSPPTRLSPENKKGKTKKLTFTRTEAGQIARDLQREFDQEDVLLEELRKKHSTKSWFELQLEEHMPLSDEQRNYANELIKKYTGIKL